jgi:molecular chaperone GrpE
MMDESKIQDIAPNEAVTSDAGSNSQEVASATGQNTGAENAEEGTTIDYPALIGELEARLSEERTRADKLQDQAQRLAAEFQNSRRRQENQLSEEIERAAAHLIKRLLPVIDDFDLAFAHVPPQLEEGAAFVEGFRQIQKKLHNILAEDGVTPVPGAGEFDPTLHEAISAEPSADVPSGHIIDTLRTGYTYKGKVLRPALVRVAM